MVVFHEFPTRNIKMMPAQIIKVICNAFFGCPSIFVLKFPFNQTSKFLEPFCVDIRRCLKDLICVRFGVKLAFLIILFTTFLNLKYSTKVNELLIRSLQSLNCSTTLLGDIKPIVILLKEL